MNFIVFGAHPDDPDLMFGGTAVRLTQAGHRVQFVSVTDGSAGHQTMPPRDLARRRYQETQNSARSAGIEKYTVLNHPDGYLENNVNIREELTAIIRRFEADVVITHRCCDYHPDHRNTAQIVLDTAFLVQVPSFCPGVPVPDKTPVYAHSFDRFTDPRPFRIDAAVNIDDEIPRKIAMCRCHVSQFFEWLPYVELNLKNFDADKLSDVQKNQWIYDHWFERYRIAAKIAGMPPGSHAEALEISPYGRYITGTEFKNILLSKQPPI